MDLWLWGSKKIDVCSALLECRSEQITNPRLPSKATFKYTHPGPTVVTQDEKTSSKPQEKTIIIGLDGATWDNLLPWIEAGKLPVFKEFMENGTKATLHTTIPSSTIPALPSLYTGMNPGEHGILKFTKPSGEVVHMSDVAYPKIWNILDRNDLSSLIFNVRFTYPPEPLNGIFFSGNPHPPGAQNLSYPQELLKEYPVFGDKEIYDRMRALYPQLPGKNRELLEENIQTSKQKFEVFKALVEKQDFDFIFYWNGRTDGAQHMLWDYQELVLELYHHVEEILSYFRERFPDANLVILSDHGFHQAPTQRFHVNNYLEQQGYLVRTGGGLSRKLMDMIYFVGRNYVPAWLVKRFVDRNRAEEGKQDKGSEPEGETGKRPKLYEKSLKNLPGIDYKKSRAILREPWGIELLNYQSQEEYDTLAGELMESLYAARHQDKAIVDFVVKKQDFYDGHYLPEIPDLIFHTKADFLAEHELSGNIVSSFRGRSKLWKSGEHRNARKGIFLAAGPSVRKGEDIGTIHILDVLPTVLQFLRRPVPAYLDGQVRTELFSETVSPKIDPRSPEFFLTGEEKEELTQEEKDQMKDRLRSLGYFDEI